MEVTNSGFTLSSQLSSQNVIATDKSTSTSEFSAILSNYVATANQSVNTVADSQASTPVTLYPMNTSKGDKELNLDEYLAPPGPLSGSQKLGDIPLLLPSAHNIDTLTKYSQEKVQDLLAEYDIPSPPDTIEFDTEGQLVLPSDYPYAAQLKQALSENPTVEKALKSTAALASHYAGIMEGQPFRDEMATARTQADRDRIIDKYAYLFDQNRASPQIVLSFLDNGEMLVGQKQSV